jgi:pseudouridine synthase
MLEERAKSCILPSRLDKLLREALGGSRDDWRAAIDAGRVRVNGEAARDGFVLPADVVEVDGVAVHALSPTGVVMWHKPEGLVSTRRDPDGRPDLGALLSALPPRYFHVGRLDMDTTGLLLATDDGDLAHMLLHPRHHLPKTYHLQVTGPLAPDDPRLALLVAGVTLRDGPARALSLEVIDPGPVSTLALTIDEGRNRIVRRMARQVRLDLLTLHRVRMGPVVLDVPPLVHRPLRPDEYDELWHAVGGRAAYREAQVAALARHAGLRREGGQPDLRLEAWLDTNRSALADVARRDPQDVRDALEKDRLDLA